MMKPDINTPISKLPKWQQITFFVFMVLGGLSLMDKAKTYYEQNTAPTSAESAQNKMIGVWTYTEPINFGADPFPFDWVKWDIRNDGTMAVWHASPTKDNWGEVQKVKYEIISGKFAANGERWFGIADPNGYTVGVYEGGNIVLHMLPEANKNTGRMQRGDKNPFSK